MIRMEPISKKMDKIPISEVFESIQGEGPLMGRYSLFIRFAGCNLVSICKSCDTDFSVKMMVDVDYIVRKIIEFVSKGGKVVVFTGGEPGLYLHVLDEILDKVLFQDIIFQVETNGTIKLSNRFLMDKRTIIVVSPKKGFHDIAIKNYAGIDKVHFKVVIGAPMDDSTFWDFDSGIRFIKEIIEKYNHKKENIWLMPFGGDIETLVLNRRKVWEYAVNFRVNYSPRLHVEVFEKSMPGV